MFKRSLHGLRRHPVPIAAFFRRSLVLTYAFPSGLLRPLLPDGLVLDTYGQYGFLAIALVEARRLRPSFLPAALGRDVFLAGYRIFTRLQGPAGSKRGLRILRSDTDRRWMVLGGNLLTHYQYSLCQADVVEQPGQVRWRVRTPQAQADLDVLAFTANGPAPLPAGSVFANQADARRFAGPLPYTFDYEPETRSIISIRALRGQWSPLPVAVEIGENTFLRQPPFCRAAPILSNAFYVSQVPYQWQRGTRIPLGAQ
jgi:hypothetical protein